MESGALRRAGGETQARKRAEQRGQGVKILFIMPNTHYLRNFESVIGALADKGHKVILGLERSAETMPPEIQCFVEALLRSHEGAIEIMCLPERQSFWSGAAAQLRAWRDYGRYFLPLHQKARRCAGRAGSFLVPPLLVLGGAPEALRAPAARAIGGFSAWAEEVLPVEAGAIEAIGACAPDIVLLTPLIDLGSDQVDYVKASRALGIPIGHCVASWDNLTNKGLIKALPDRVFVWNEAQKAEAVRLHGVPAERVAVTGAQLFDRWFEWKPSRDRESFCAEIGLDPSKPILLYTASSVFICRSEIEFVIRWLKAIRNSEHSRLSEAGVIIRPHPKAAKTLGQWDSKDLQALGRVVVFPRGGHMPLQDEARNDYYDSLYHSAAVVGINTSAMVEAAIVGRRSFTVLLDELREGQDGMVHFQHLTQDGFLGVAESLEEHVRQLADELGKSTSQSGGNDRTRHFVRSFLRPYGLDQAATPRFVTEVEGLEGLPVEARSFAAKWGWTQRPLLLPFVALAAFYDEASVRRRKERRKAWGRSIESLWPRTRKGLRRLRPSKLVRALRRGPGKSAEAPMAEDAKVPPPAGEPASSTTASAKPAKSRNRAAA